MKTELYNIAQKHGFSVTTARSIEELEATLVVMTHKRTALPLYFLDRHDTNMTFAIGFRTAPTSDSGIFHILEHSVLCGSRRFPVKDPFSEMLKSSVSTYLNALTYPDRTVYPVSSKNGKAFLDLAEVYLDAVFHPLVLTEKNIFLQEGHRLELDEDGNVYHTGVVYNEMQGALAAVDDYAELNVDRLMFSGGTYGYDSGGTPEGIATLSHSDLVEAHKKYYHPTNGFIFLDGDVDLDRILSLINRYLDEFEKSEAYTALPRGRVAECPEMIGYHPDVPDGKCEIHICNDIESLSTREQLSGLLLIEDAICDANSSPLKERMLDSGLCENFSFYVNTSSKYPTLNAYISGVDEYRYSEAIELYRDTVRRIAESGIDRDALTASLNSFEFRARESDCGTFPKGIALMSAVTEAIVTGRDPVELLKYNDLYRDLRNKLSTEYFCDLLRAATQGSKEVRLVIKHGDMPSGNVPTPPLTDELAKRLRSEADALTRWQRTPDPDEALASVPVLKREDLDPKINKIPTKISTRDGATVLYHPISTGGISYVDIYFDCSDINEDDLPYLSLLATVYPELHTRKHSSYEFSNLVKRHLGNLTTSTAAIKRGDEGRIFFTVKASLLDTEKRVAPELIRELIFDSLLDDTDIVNTVIAQLAINIPTRLNNGAHRYAINRAAARYDVLDAIKERTSGIEFLRALKRISEDSELRSRLPKKFEEIRTAFFRRERLTVAFTGEEDESLASKLVELIPSGACPCGACRVSLLPERNEYVSISSPVFFTALMSNFKKCAGAEYHGGFSAVGTIMSLELLWNKIRVEGGAYDTGFIARANSGGIGYYSYRDPSPIRSIDVFFGAAKELEGLAKADGFELEKYIIGSVGSADTVTTPRSDGALENINYLSGITYDDRVRYLSQLVELTPEELSRLAGIIAKSLTRGTTCILGDKDALTSLGVSEDSIISI